MNPGKQEQKRGEQVGLGFERGIGRRRQADDEAGTGEPDQGIAYAEPAEDFVGRKRNQAEDRDSDAGDDAAAAQTGQRYQEQLVDFRKIIDRGDESLAEKYRSFADQNAVAAHAVPLAVVAERRRAVREQDQQPRREHGDGDTTGDGHVRGAARDEHAKRPGAHGQSGYQQQKRECLQVAQTAEAERGNAPGKDAPHAEAEHEAAQISHYAVGLVCATQSRDAGAECDDELEIDEVEERRRIDRVPAQIQFGEQQRYGGTPALAPPQLQRTEYERERECFEAALQKRRPFDMPPERPVAEQVPHHHADACAGSDEDDRKQPDSGVTGRGGVGGGRSLINGGHCSGAAFKSPGWRTPRA